MGYAKMPLSLFRDSRLLKNDLRVLAVLIFRSNKEGKCWPTLTDISEQSGLRYSRISGITKRLKSFGLIDKKLKKNGTNNLLIYTVFSQQSPSEVYPLIGETIYPLIGETTPITIKHKTRNQEKDASVSSKRPSLFSSLEILSVKIPQNLAEEKGFISAWENWVKTKVEQKNKKDRFSDAEEVEDLLLEMSEWFADGLDVIDGLKTAKRKKWRDCRKHYFHDLSKVKKPKLSKSEEIDKAFADFRKNNDADNRIRNAGDPQNTDRDLLEFSGGSVHSESVGVGTRRLLT